MARIARKNLNTTFLHIMVQGVNKEYIFEKEFYKIRYLRLINEIKNEYSFTIIAYCIMDNHAHFLVHTDDIESFGRFMHKLNFLFATLYNKLENRVGVLFRNRYKAEAIIDRRYLITCIKYIHENPVKAGIVIRCQDYKYSSYNDYINHTGILKNADITRFLGDNFECLMQSQITHERQFMDIDTNINCEDLYRDILSGIQEYCLQNNVKIDNIFSTKVVFKDLIKFLNSTYKIKYKEMKCFFEISQNSLKYILRK